MLVCGNEGTALAIMTRRVTLWIASLQTTIESTDSSTCVQFMQELNLLGRLALYWAYEVCSKGSGLLISSTEVDEQDSAAVITSRALCVACALAGVIWERMACEWRQAVCVEDMWKWALMADIAAVEQAIAPSDWSSDGVCHPLRLLDTPAPLQALSGIDKTLLSKLCVGAAVVDSEALQTEFPAAGPGSCAALVDCFISPPSHSSTKSSSTKGGGAGSSPSELAAKLTVVCFQRVYKSAAELHLGVALQLSARAMHILALYASENYPASSSDEQLADSLAKYIAASLHRLADAKIELSSEWVWCLDMLCAQCVRCVIALNSGNDLSAHISIIRGSIRSRIANIVCLVLMLLQGGSECYQVVAAAFLPILLRVDSSGACIPCDSEWKEKIVDIAAELILQKALQGGCVTLEAERQKRCPAMLEMPLTDSSPSADTLHIVTRYMLVDMTMTSLMRVAKGHIESLVNDADEATYSQITSEFIDCIANYLSNCRICDTPTVESVRVQLMCDAYWSPSACVSGVCRESPEQGILDHLSPNSGALGGKKRGARGGGGHWTAASTRFKAYMLLLQLQSPSTSSLDTNSTEGTQLLTTESCDNMWSYMECAVTCWKEMASQRMESSTVLVSFHSDTLQLLHFLGWHGFVDCQISIMEAWCTAYYNSTLRNNCETLMSYLLSMKCSMAIWSCLNNMPTAQFTERILHLPSETACWAEDVLHFVRTVSVHFDRCDVTKADSLPSMPFSRDNSFAEYCDAAERVMKPLRSSTCRQNAVHCWMMVLHSKLCVLLGGQHLLALSWAKKALQLLKGNTAAGGKEGHIDSLALEMECMLLIADLHEMTGSVEKCLSYLAEAKALSSRCFSIMYRKVYSLHATRLWLRLGSSRHSNELEYLREPMPTTSVNTSLGSNISYLATECGDIIYGIISNDAPPVHWQDQISYRHCNMTWDVEAVGDLKFHTSIPLYLRRTIKRILSVPSVPNDKSIFSGLSSKQGPFWVDILREHSNLFVGDWFDVVRNARRRVSSDIMTSFGPQAADLKCLGGMSSLQVSKGEISSATFLPTLAFVLGAGSCGTSVECSLENKAEAMNDRHARLGRACQLVGSACCGDENALADIDSLLSAPVTSLSANGCKSVYCFMTVDHSRRRVLIGRKDGSAWPVVASLAAYESFEQALVDWKDIMACNKSQLQKTMNAVDVSSWGKSEKVKWWNERDQLDQRMKAFFENVEFMLGPWRCLLAPTALTSSLKANAGYSECCTKLLELFRRYSSAKEPKKKASKKGSAHASARDALDDVDAAIEGVLAWVSLLVCPDNGLEKCERVAGLKEVLQAALQPLAEEGAVGLEEDTLQVSITIIDACRGRDIDRQRPQSSPSTTARNSDALCQEKITEMRFRVAGLKVVDLKSELRDAGLDTSGKKAELAERLSDFLEKQLLQLPGIVADDMEVVTTQEELSPTQTGSRASCHITLILDENLQMIPWESLPLLRQASCSRVPSLSLLITLLQGRSAPDSVGTDVAAGKENTSGKSARKTAKPKTQDSHIITHDPNNEDHYISVARCWYTVDPDANLERTRSTMMSFIEPYATRWQWPGYSGERPPEDVIR